MVVLITKTSKFDNLGKIISVGDDVPFNSIWRVRATSGDSLISTHVLNQKATSVDALAVWTLDLREGQCKGVPLREDDALPPSSPQREEPRWPQRAVF